MDLLKSEDEKEQRVAQTLLPFTPLFLLSVHGNFSVEFDDDDFDEVKDHPMAAPAMATFT